MLLQKINIKYFRNFLIYFFILPIIITLTHELGHFATSNAFGYKSRMTYKLNYWEDANKPFLDSTELKYKRELLSGSEFPGKQKYFTIREKISKDAFWIRLWGPIVTVSIGSIAFLILLLKNGLKKQSVRLTFVNVILGFLALFWVRQIINLIFIIINTLYPFKESVLVSDERYLSIVLKLNPLLLDITTGILGIFIALYVTFILIPIKLRFEFITAGFLGVALGSLVWFFFVGPILLPVIR